MHNAIKIVVALLVVALVAVVGLIILTMGAGEPTTTVATQTTADVNLTATEKTETTGTENSKETPQPEVTAEPAQTNEAAKEAQDEAQGMMYEGALAGLSEEEIAALAMAEEQAVHDEELESEGAEGAVD